GSAPVAGPRSGRVLRPRGTDAAARIGGADPPPAQSEARDRRRPADDGGRSYPARRPGRGGGAPALLRARLPDLGAPVGEAGRGSEPRAARDRLRPPLGRI